jgi:small ligand-binding sensory domain FIST
VSVWAGRTGPAEAVRLEVVRSADGTAVVGMPDAAAVGRRTLILLSEPHSFPTDAFLQAGNEQYPDLAIVGGMASAGGPGANRLVVQGETHTDGAVGILLPEGLDDTAVVSQGCRPVGEPLIVTSSERNLVSELASRPALDRLRTLLDDADDDERALLSRGLHVGLVIDERPAEFGRGDFLIRGVLGADHEAGAIRIGDHAPVGTTLQFHVRDAASASDDLREMLAPVEADAALVFTCNGRGIRLFGTPDHDAEMVHNAVHGGAVAGMFCAGELGPVGGRNHVHGFTASILLFYG